MGNDDEKYSAENPPLNVNKPKEPADAQVGELSFDPTLADSRVAEFWNS